MKTMPSLTIIIVNYNSGALTHACLESLLSQSLPEQTEIVVVDNNSSDESVSFLRADFPQATVIANSQNKGLAAAVNQALAASQTDYYLLLNPDIIALNGAVSELIKFMEQNPTVGLAGGKLLSPNGQLQHSAFRFYTPLTILYRRTFLGRIKQGKRVVDHFLMKDFDHASVRDVPWLMGSCHMLRRLAVEEVGGMDQRFFLYFEDVDWCRRFWEHNWRVTYVPSARFSHFHQQSSRQNPWLGIITNWTARQHVKSAWLYFLKYRGRPLPFVEREEIAA